MKKTAKTAIVTAFAVCGMTAFAAAMTPGSYTGSSDSVGGPLTVEVTVSESAIENIEVTECSDTKGVGDVAIDRLVPMMLDNQSINVDTVSGATLTSIFLKNAVKNALAEAGADADEFQEKISYAAEAQSDMETDIVVVGGGLAGMSAVTEAAGSGIQVVLVEKLAYLGGDAIVSDQGCVNTFNPPVDTGFAEAVTSLAEKDIPIRLAEYPGIGEDASIAVEDTGDFDVMYKLVGHMRDSAESDGALILLDTPATGLLVEDGAVKGVTAQPKGQDEFSIHAKAVILCTGGFSSNSELVDEYLPYAQGARKMGLGGNTGDALEWIREVNGKTVMLDAADSSFMLANPMTGAAASFWMAGNNYVNELGEAITDDASYNLGAEAVYRTVGGEHVWNMYSVSDAEAQGITSFLEKSVHNKTAVFYESMEEIAKAYDMPSLVDTLKARGYEDSEKWYVMEGIASIYGTYGGIGVDIDSRVLNENDEAVPGLYAAGEVIGSREYQQNGAYGGGLAPALTVGYIAARTAADDIAR
ncbi:MAG: FAD-dependent oxidoreductase [Lachnospiraceae bacterium]|nr:FAD-dependent oxidoreductase [Lachnospiraceae bacterium]